MYNSQAFPACFSDSDTEKVCPLSSNTERRKMYSLKLILFIKLLVILSLFPKVSSAQQCPTTACSCEDGDNRGRIIDCRNLGLTGIPHFNATDEMFWELTLSNHEGPNDQHANPNGCSYCNKITSLPANAFAGLNVRRIDLRKNALTTVEQDAFNGSEDNLTELLIEGNGSVMPPYNALVNLTNLTLLSMEHFDQVSIEEENEYGNFGNLKTLELKYMKMMSISSRAFVGKLSNLTKLTLIQNPLLSFPAGALQKLVSLVSLTIIDAQFHTIPTNATSKLQKLTELDLTANQISTLSPGCFDGIEDNLQILNLQRNMLSSEAKLDPILTVQWRLLDQLNLAHNSIQTLRDAAFHNMPELAYLNLANNELTSITANLFSGLGKMHHIDMSSNKITSIENGAFTHVPLMALLDIIDQNFLPDMKLDLSEESFKGLENSLHQLSLQHTVVNEDGLWASLRPLSQIQSLDLSHTGLQSIPDFVFSDNKKINYLELSANNISIIKQESFHGLRDSLATLSLSYNKIATINHCVFDNFTNLRQLHLRDNPAICNCDMQWLHDWITDHSDPLIGIAVVQCVCAQPPSLANQPIQNVARENLTCAENHTEAVCFNYYTTTTTTTTPATTTIPMPILTLTVSVQTLYALSVEWNVSDPTYVTGFKLLYNKYGTSDPAQEILFSMTDRGKVLNSLEADSSYNVCLQVEIQNSFDETPQICKVKKTAITPMLTIQISMAIIDSLTVGWTVDDKQYVTSFVLSYVSTSSNNSIHVPLSKTNDTYNIEGLDENSSYEICVTAELQGRTSEDPLVKCQVGQTIQNPVLMISISNETTDSIFFIWSVSDDTYVTGFKLQYEKLGIDQVENEERIHKADRNKFLEHLDSHSSYEICLSVEIQDRFWKSPKKCVVGKTKPIPTTPSPVTEAKTGLSQAQIGTIAGSVVGAVVFAILLAAILYILLKQRDEQEKAPEAVVIKAIRTRAPAPRVGYDSKRFSKPKKDKVQPSDPKDVNITIISKADMNGADQSRVSAGSYQNLHTDTPHVNTNPMPTTSRDSDHYVNSMDSRPLPRTPYYAVGPGHFNQAHRSDTPSSNHYDEIGIETGL